MKLKDVVSVALLSSLSTSVSAAEIPEDIHSGDYKWLNAHIYRGIDQRGGPFEFDDNYFELEFGGRSGILDFYGYVDFLVRY